MGLDRIDLGNVAIIGLGVSGSAAAQFCLNHLKSAETDRVSVSSFTIYAGKRVPSTEAAAQRFIDAGIDVIFDCEEVEGGFDLAVVSPGISENSGFYASAKRASADIVSEPELAFRISPADWIGITGTNGKTTTTMLVDHLLRTCGFDSCTVGNIGDPCITAADERPAGRFFSAELSSYQLATTAQFKPRVGILLNVTPDHLSWHGSHEAYRQAKFKLFANMDADDCAIIDCQDPADRAFASELAMRGVKVVALGGPDGMGCRCDGFADLAFVEDGVLKVLFDGKELEICLASELQIKGEHNLQNALAACSAALAVGGSLEAIAEGLRTFSPVEHRIEPCGTLHGVRFYNDSKATNVDAVLKALTAFSVDDGVIILLGGRDKGTDLSELVADCYAKCKAVICYGESKERFLEAFSSGASEADLQKLHEAVGMADALEKAARLASDGDSVLLSPACASFDEFNSFEHRGETFKKLVAELIAKEDGGTAV